MTWPWYHNAMRPPDPMPPAESVRDLEAERREAREARLQTEQAKSRAEQFFRRASTLAHRAEFEIHRDHFAEMFLHALRKGRS